MANLLGSGSFQYKGILNLDATTVNTPLDTTLRAVTDGMGNASPLQLNTTLIGITSAINIGGTFTNLARCHVRGDGVNPIARFENSTGTQVLGISGNLIAIGREGNIGAVMYSFNASESTPDALGFGFGFGSFKTIFVGNPYDVYFSGTNLILTSGTANLFTIKRTIGAAAGSGSCRPLNIEYIINNTGAQTGTATGILINATETNLNGMGHRLIDLQVGGASRFRVSNNGTIFATLQTGNAGLVTGQMYKDTAANILSNSDFVVGMKA